MRVQTYNSRSIAGNGCFTAHPNKAIERLNISEPSRSRVRILQNGDEIRIGKIILS